MPEIHLSWQPGYSLFRKPAKRPAAPRRNRRQRFEFVVEHPQRACRAEVSPSPTAFARTESPDSLREHPSTVNARKTCFEREAVKDNRHLNDKPSEPLDVENFGRGEVSLNPQTFDEAIETRLISHNDEDQSTCSLAREFSTGEHRCIRSGPSADLISTFANIPSPLFTVVPLTIEYISLNQRFKPILDRCMHLTSTQTLSNYGLLLSDNAELCMIPLTFHLRINPFRYRTDLDPEPAYLIHAVMALAGHHVGSNAALSHRHEALQLLRRSLDIFDDSETMYSALDTIIVLFSLDVSQIAVCLRPSLD